MAQKSGKSLNEPRRNANRKFLDSARQSQELLRELVKRRKRQRLSQVEVATRMGTSQSAVARIETAGMDIRMSTLERYAAAIGHQVNFKLTRLPPGGLGAAGNKEVLFVKPAAGQGLEP